MLCREKMFLIASNVDDSIKSSTSVYDITLFKTFVDFERYVNNTPVLINTLVLTTNELQFNSSNMARLLAILDSPFIRIQGNIVYLVDYSYDLNTINEFLNSKGITDWAVYQGNLSSEFISDIVSGEGRETVEGQVQLITYRLRASEYIKQQQQLKYQTDEEKYYTDEDLLSGIPDVQEPENINPTIDKKAVTDYIVGMNSKHRAIMAFLIAQYRSLTDKTIIIERDVEYHTLTELVTKSGIDCKLIMIEDILNDIFKAITEIKSTQSRLIVIGAINRSDYNYNFIADILYSNLKNDIHYFVRECSYEEVPYGLPYIIVTENTIPDVLECCNSLNCDILPEDVIFVGMQIGSLGPINITTDEMKSIVSVVLEKSNIITQVIKINGILLKGDKVTYDILSIINRENK